MDVIDCCADLVGCEGAASSGDIAIRRRDRGAEAEHRQRQAEDHPRPAACSWRGGVGRGGGERSCGESGFLHGLGVGQGGFHGGGDTGAWVGGFNSVGESNVQVRGLEAGRE